MNISQKWDPVSSDVPPVSKFTDAVSSPTIQPYEKAIPECAGEKASNDVTGLSYKKAQPFGKGGSGYCD